MYDCFRKSSNTISIFLLLLCGFACTKNGQEVLEGDADIESNVTRLEIEDAGVLTLKLDLEANFQFLQEIRGIHLDGQDLVTFVSRDANAIYLYDTHTGELVSKTVMDKEGPNAVKSFFQFSYFFHTRDSIFVNGLPVGLYLINSEGKVLERKNLRSDQEIPRFDSPKPRFDFASSFENGKISMPTEFSIQREKVNERIVFDFDKDVLADEYIPTEMIIPDIEEVRRIKKERVKRGEFGLINFRSFADNGEYLFATHVISDTIYAFQEGKLKKKIYAGVPEIEIADYASYVTIRSIVRFENGVDGSENPKQDPLFKNTIMSPDGKFIYRVLYHGTRPKMIEGSDQPVPDIIGATLVVLDLETEALTYFDLPVDEIELGIPINRHVFVTNKGIYFRVLDQENEDEVQFRLFELRK